MRSSTLLLALACAGCGSSGAPGATASASASAAPSAAPTSLTHGSAKDLAVTWTAPEGWKKVAPSSPMRNASYEVPAAAGDAEPGDLGVSYFGPDGPRRGGAVERNVKRWVDQFEAPDAGEAPAVKRSDRSANGLTQHVVEVESGTYKSGMPGGPTTPKADFALLGAIVETPSGSHFFKLVGPKATVAAARAQFFTLLDSVKPKG